MWDGPGLLDRHRATSHFNADADDAYPMRDFYPRIQHELATLMTKTTKSTSTSTSWSNQVADAEADAPREFGLYVDLPSGQRSSSSSSSPTDSHRDNHTIAETAESHFYYPEHPRHGTPSSSLEVAKRLVDGASASPSTSTPTPTPTTLPPIKSALPLLHRLRLRKSPWEVAQMQKAADISGRAMATVMKQVRRRRRRLRLRVREHLTYVCYVCVCVCVCVDDDDDDDGTGRLASGHHGGAGVCVVRVRVS